MHEVRPILDLIAENDIVLSGGHLHISEIFPLFEEAKKRGVKRLLVQPPDLRRSTPRTTTSGGSSRWAPTSSIRSACSSTGSKFKFYDPPELDALIEAGTVERTILGSDLGQQGNPRLVDGFRNVIATCLDLGYGEPQVRRMISGNAAELMGL